MNRKITKVYGYTREDTPTAMKWVETVFPDPTYRKFVVDWWDEAIKQAALGSGLIDDIEFQLVAKDGTRRDVLYNGYLSGSHLILTLQDVTAQKQAAAKLEASYKNESILRAQAEEAAKAKVRFLAGVSHEIRTPISALVNISQSMLLESDKHSLPAEFLEHLETVRSGGQYLNLILTNLLDVSAAESGHTPVRATTFYVRDWVEDIGAILEPIARSRSVQIVWRLPEDDNEKFTTDSVRLSQILLNLAHNAVKFSVKADARVWISVSTLGESVLRLSVADEGPGIPPERLEALYQEFGQSEAEMKSVDRGVGLGLAVVRQNIDLLGGKISARPLAPSGICFEIELPGLKNSESCAP
ncbi:MAG: ATP-binding protein [Spartobacteria bacterium]